MHRKGVMKGMRLKKRALKVEASRNQANRRRHKLPEAPAQISPALISFRYLTSLPSGASPPRSDLYLEASRDLQMSKNEGQQGQLGLPRVWY